eukprot:1059988_1
MAGVSLGIPAWRCTQKSARASAGCARRTSDSPTFSGRFPSERSRRRPVPAWAVPSHAPQSMSALPSPECARRRLCGANRIRSAERGRKGARLGAPNRSAPTWTPPRRAVRRRTELRFALSVCTLRLSPESSRR